MGLFGKVQDAKPSMDANYDRDGDYVSILLGVKEGKTRQGDEFVAIEKQVIAVIDDGEGKGHKVGENVTHMMMTRFDSFAGNFKAFVMNVIGCSDGDVTEESCDEITSDLQPMAGMVIRHRNNTILTKGKQKPFTVVSYKGQIQASEISKLLGDSESLIERFFPDGRLDEMIAQEAEDD